jgi:hypothetical protein
MLLTFVQTAPTLITYVNFAALFYIIYMHWNRKQSRWLKAAYGIIFVECVAVLLCGMACPVRLWVTRHYSSSTPDQIILNNIAPYYMKAGSVLLVIAILTYFFPRQKGKSR